jgi:hypothetical protein
MVNIKQTIKFFIIIWFANVIIGGFWLWGMNPDLENSMVLEIETNAEALGVASGLLLITFAVILAIIAIWKVENYIIGIVLKKKE